LVYDKSLISKTSMKRLKVMRETNDGFLIAETDLKIRGGGEVLGTKQSGLPEFKIASLSAHYDLLKTSNSHAKLILNADPDLSSERGKNIRELLKIFNYKNKLRLKSFG